MANGETIDPTTISGYVAAAVTIIGGVAAVIKLLNSDSSQFRKDILGRLTTVETANGKLQRRLDSVSQRLDDERQRTGAQNELLRIVLGKLKEVMLGANQSAAKHGEAAPYKSQDWDYTAELDAIEEIGKDRPKEFGEQPGTKNN